MTAVYWLSPLGGFDDFDSPYDLKPGGIMYDARTKHGPWANMTEDSFQVHGAGRLGPGYGQKYQMQEDGRWLKIAG
jgi:hypothetical protein